MHSFRRCRSEPAGVDADAASAEGRDHAIGTVFKESEGGTRYQVVGIVPDLQHRSFTEAPKPMAYFCADQQYDARMTLHVRTTMPAAAVVEPVLRTLHETNRAAALTRVETMAEYMDRVTMPQRLGGMAAEASPTSLLVLKRQLWADMAGSLEDSVARSVDLMLQMIGAPDFTSAKILPNNFRYSSFAFNRSTTAARMPSLVAGTDE